MMEGISEVKDKTSEIFEILKKISKKVKENMESQVKVKEIHKKSQEMQ